MSLSAADRLGPYQIVDRIGAGGMGEVYRALDTRLDRMVAIKVSAEHFSERFKREAHAIASLNHANICTLFDVGPDYLVMEYIDGKQLNGPLPVGEVIKLGIQIAEAVSQAHRQGVIHRDLKPGNILITKSGAKVLDFGLAKLSRPDASSADRLRAETLTHAITQEGTIVGTPNYMAPEQLQGQEADARTDIFAFGLVLYEMLAGRPAFEGKTKASLIAAILTSEPQPIANFQPAIPPALTHVIKTCLSKDPDDRYQSLHDVALQLRWIAEGGPEAGIQRTREDHKWRKYMSWAFAGLLSAALATIAFVHFREKALVAYPVRFEQAPPASIQFRPFDKPTISPDGRSLAFNGSLPGQRSMLWLRRFDTLRTTAIPGTEDSMHPFWSSDSRSIGFFAGGKLKKVDMETGATQILCDAPNAVGGTWSNEGIILVGASPGAIQRTSAAGGDLKPVLKVDATSKDSARSQYWPQFLPDGRHFVFTSSSSEPNRTGVYLASIDSTESRLLLQTRANASVVSPGFIVFARGSALFAQRFDFKKLQLSGEPFALADTVASTPSHALSRFSVSLNGLLAYLPGSSGNVQPVWYNAEGKQLGLVGEPRGYRQAILSPDEKRLAAQIADPARGEDDLWLLELSSGILSRFTTDEGTEDSPVWSPDGREIMFSVVARARPVGRRGLHRKLMGTGEDQLHLSSDEIVYPEQWLKDGSVLFLNTGGRSFYRLSASAGSKPEPLLKTTYFKDGPRVSPDGRWVVYSTDESGRWEVYIASFPAFTERRQVSNGGGVQGHWHKSGERLFYLTLDGKIMSVPVKTGSPPETGIPVELFQTRASVTPTAEQFSVLRDGRFLVLDAVEPPNNAFTIVMNWPNLAKP